MINNIEKKVIDTNIENFNKFQIEISSLAIKTMIDLYSNKELAVVRELLTNAWDSHIESNNTNKAIDVEITNDTFRIRDYGTGISEKRMYDYCTIYKSSKTNTNSQTGCFGLGSKVPFCIVDNYIVNSYYNGTKLSYLMSIADDFPTFTQLSKTETNKENGLELIINTNTSKFKDYVAKYYIFSNMKINVISGIDKDNLKYNLLFEDDLIKVVLSEFPNKEKFYINYGNNLYRNLEFNSNFNLPKDSYALNMINILKKYLANTSKNNKYFTIIFKIPLSVGLTITPSRELFEDTDDNKNKLNSYIYEYLEHKLERKNIKINDKWEIDSNSLVNNTIHYLPTRCGFNILEVLTKYLKNKDRTPNAYDFVFCNTNVLQKKSLLNTYSNIMSHTACIDKFTGLLQQNNFMYKIVFNNCNIDDNTIFIDKGYNFKKKHKIRLLLLNINHNENKILLQEFKNLLGKSKKLKEHLTLYTNILTIHKDIPFEVIRQFVDFIKIFYDVELHYSKLSTIVNKLKIKKRTNSISVGRYKFFVNDKFYKMKEFDMEVQNKNYTIYYTNNKTYVFVDLLHKIKNKFKELPVGLQKVLLSDKDIKNFIEDKNYVYIMLSTDWDNLIDYLKDNYNFVDFQYTLYKMLNKIKHYGLYSFQNINSAYTNYFNFTSRNYDRNNNLIPFESKLFNYIYNLYKKRKPTTLIGKNIYKHIMELKKMYDLYKFINICGMTTYTYIINYEYLFNNITNTDEVNEITNKIYKFLRYYKKKNCGTLTKNDFLKLSYRGVL